MGSSRKKEHKSHSHSKDRHHQKKGHKHSHSHSHSHKSSHSHSRRTRKDVIESDSSSSSIVENQYSQDKKRNNKEVSIGPTLPSEHVIRDQEAMVGPSLPPELNKKSVIVGPSLPPELNKSVREEKKVTVGPSLPPELNKKEEKKITVGPSLPPHLLNDQTNDTITATISKQERTINDSEEDDDDDIIGPIPMNRELNEEEETQRIIREFREREFKMKKRMEDEKSEAESNTGLKRGEWMLLPPEMNRLDGLSMLKPRQFSKNGIEKDDQSVWTDTPADKLRKLQKGTKRKQEEEKVEYIQVSQKDLEAQQFVDNFNSQHRSESLLNKHTKEYYLNKKYEETDIKNLPFDRERDVIGSYRMSEKSRNNIIQQTVNLDNKFTHSSKKRFL